MFAIRPSLRRAAAGLAAVAALGTAVACAPSDPGTVPSFTVNPTSGSVAPISPTPASHPASPATVPTTAPPVQGETEAPYVAPTTTETYQQPDGTTEAPAEQFPTTFAIPPQVQLPPGFPRIITIPPLPAQ